VKVAFMKVAATPVKTRSGLRHLQVNCIGLLALSVALQDTFIAIT
jgi:hypothetical protein